MPKQPIRSAIRSVNAQGKKLKKLLKKVDGNERKKDINSINTIDNYAAHQSNYGVKMLTLIGNHLREGQETCSVWWTDETSSIDAFRTRLIDSSLDLSLGTMPPLGSLC